jgi:hypothetical protein
MTGNNCSGLSMFQRLCVPGVQCPGSLPSRKTCSTFSVFLERKSIKH